MKRKGSAKAILVFCLLAMVTSIVAGCATLEISRKVIVFDRAGRPIQGARVYMARKKYAARGMTLSDGSTKIRTFSEVISIVVEREGYEPKQVMDTTNLVIKVMLDQANGNAR